LIFPNADVLHPSLSVMQKIFGASTGGLQVLAKICSNWTSALFYIVSEIYSSVSVGLLFWQFANDVVSIDQAKRFYPLFAQMSGLAPVVAGQYMVRYTSVAPDLGTSLHRLTAAVTASGIMICTFYTFARRFLARTEPVIQGKSGKATKKSKPKMSMVESAKFLASSEYLRLIASLVLGYGLSINFTEIIWKSLVKKQYPDPLEYQKFMGNFSSAVGISTCLVIFVGVQLIRILGWRVGACATPTLMALLAAPFFACILMGLENEPSRLRLAVILGTAQSLVSKTSKYALFDPVRRIYLAACVHLHLIYLTFVNFYII
jgi:ATP:ADP antiporter, AAA family